MTIDEVLKLMIEKAHLDEVESVETERSFFEIINLTLIRKLGEALTGDQQKIFLEKLTQSQKAKNFDQAIEYLQTVSIDKSRLTQLFRGAVHESFNKIIKILGDRLPVQERKTIIQEIRNRS